MTFTDVQIQTIVMGAQAVVLLGALWVAFWQGKRSIDNLRTQTRQLQTSVQNNAYQAVISKEIDLITRLAEDAQLGEPYDASAVFPWQNVDPEERRKRWFCISRLEIFELIFLQYYNGAISEDMWRPWKDYIQSMLEISLFKDVWDKLQSFYHPEFIRSISGLTTGKQPKTKSDT